MTARASEPAEVAELGVGALERPDVVQPLGGQVAGGDAVAADPCQQREQLQRVDRCRHRRRRELGHRRERARAAEASTAGRIDRRSG